MTADPEPASAISESAAPPARSGAALRRIGLESRAYRDMLDDYLCWRLRAPGTVYLIPKPA